MKGSHSLHQWQHFEFDFGNNGYRSAAILTLKLFVNGHAQCDSFELIGHDRGKQTERLRDRRIFLADNFITKAYRQIAASASSAAQGLNRMYGGPKLAVFHTLVAIFLRNDAYLLCHTVEKLLSILAAWLHHPLRLGNGQPLGRTN